MDWLINLSEVEQQSFPTAVELSTTDKAASVLVDRTSESIPSVRISNFSHRRRENSSSFVSVFSLLRATFTYFSGIFSVIIRPEIVLPIFSSSKLSFRQMRVIRIKIQKARLTAKYALYAD